MEGGIILSGHTDVVPASAKGWSSNPFIASERDNKIYGRGSCDMKGFIACTLALAPYFAKQDLKKPIHFLTLMTKKLHAKEPLSC